VGRRTSAVRATTSIRAHRKAVAKRSTSPTGRNADRAWGTPAGTTTATVAPGPCVGDCDGNHEVAVNELVIGVNIALGSAPVSECLSFDVDGSGMVEVNELISGVNSALNGCV
jgi:hypothetical protein